MPTPEKLSRPLRRVDRMIYRLRRDDFVNPLSHRHSSKNTEVYEERDALATGNEAKSIKAKAATEALLHTPTRGGSGWATA